MTAPGLSTRGTAASAFHLAGLARVDADPLVDRALKSRVEPASVQAVAEAVVRRVGGRA